MQMDQFNLFAISLYEDSNGQFKLLAANFITDSVRLKVNIKFDFIIQFKTCFKSTMKIQYKLSDDLKFTIEKFVYDGTKHTWIASHAVSTIHLRLLTINYAIW